MIRADLIKQLCGELSAFREYLSNAEYLRDEEFESAHKQEIQGWQDSAEYHHAVEPRSTQ